MFFSGKLTPGSLDLLNIMWSFLNLSLSSVNCSLLSSFLSVMMPQNLLYLRSTEVLTKFLKDK